LPFLRPIETSPARAIPDDIGGIMNHVEELLGIVL
jgi:hypothetical protein